MAIDINKEVPVLLADFGKRLPKSVPYRTIYNWYEPGIISTRGVRVQLETVLMPTGRCTSWEAYERFIEALNHEPEIKVEE